MQFSINKMAYNVIEPNTSAEEISVSITAKFGVSIEEHTKRAFFIELNIDAKDKEGGNETRNLVVVARLNYQLDKNLIQNLNENQVEEDKTYFHELLKRVSDTVINITSQDDLERTININKALENYSI